MLKLYMMNSGEKSNEEQNLILYFQVHQPRRLNAINFFDLPNELHYFNDDLNGSILRRIATHCYLPANRLLLDLVREHPEIKVTFSLSGVVLEQLEVHAPAVIDSFRQLAQTGSVEFLSETYYHSLASLVNTDEFESQVLLHAGKIFDLFGVRPVVFRNTELIYNDEIGRRVARLGFRGIFTEGHENLLGEQSPHQLYCHPDESQLKIFLRNYRLSDDISFRFMEGGRRLDLRKYLAWLDAMPRHERLINIAMDYETFGEHHRADTGIFDFLRDLLRSLAHSERYRMVLPSQAVEGLAAEATLSRKECVSWADLERDVSAWLGNDMQRDAFNSVMKLEKGVKVLGDQQLLECWRYLQTSDHFYYMSVKTDTDGSVHSYFSPFPSSYEAFINFMNAVTHLKLQVQARERQSVQPGEDMSATEAERQHVAASPPVWALKLESAPHHNVPDVEP